MTADEKIEHLLKEKKAKEALEHCLEIYEKIKHFKTPSSSKKVRIPTPFVGRLLISPFSHRTISSWF